MLREGRRRGRRDWENRDLGSAGRLGAGALRSGSREPWVDEGIKWIREERNSAAFFLFKWKYS